MSQNNYINSFISLNEIHYFLKVILTKHLEYRMKYGEQNLNSHQFNTMMLDIG